MLHVAQGICRKEHSKDYSDHQRSVFLGMLKKMFLFIEMVPLNGLGVLKVVIPTKSLECMISRPFLILVIDQFPCMGDLEVVKRVDVSPYLIYVGVLYFLDGVCMQYCKGFFQFSIVLPIKCYYIHFIEGGETFALLSLQNCINPSMNTAELYAI